MKVEETLASKKIWEYQDFFEKVTIVPKVWKWKWKRNLVCSGQFGPLKAGVFSISTLASEAALPLWLFSSCLRGWSTSLIDITWPPFPTRRRHRARWATLVCSRSCLPGQRWRRRHGRGRDSRCARLLLWGHWGLRFLYIKEMIHQVFGHENALIC